MDRPHTAFFCLRAYLYLRFLAKKVMEETEE
jgi:hypothetical protein